MKTSFVDATIDLAPDDVSLTEAGILVVDEDPAFQLGLKTFLKEYVGFEKVFTARNGREAIDLIKREKSIELITVDYQMPEMDGLELLEHLQKHTPRPIGATMITGFPSEELKKEFARLTSSKLLTGHFLSKPVEFEKLEPIILESYEDLKLSQQLSDTMTGTPEEDEFYSDEEIDLPMSSSNLEILARFDSLEQNIAANTRALQELKKGNGSGGFFGFCTDILKILIAAALIYAAWESGLVERAKNFVRSQLATSLPVGQSDANTTGSSSNNLSAAMPPPAQVIPEKTVTTEPPKKIVEEPVVEEVPPPEIAPPEIGTTPQEPEKNEGEALEKVAPEKTEPSVSEPKPKLPKNTGVPL